MKNRINIIGRIGSDLEDRVAGGKIVTSFSLAYTKKEKTTWFKCTWWSMPDVLKPYVRKGDMIDVVGELELSTYNDKSYLNVIIREATLLPNKREQATAAQTSDNSERSPF